MNRAERRKSKSKVKDPVYHLKQSDITKIKEETMEDVSKMALSYTVVLPILVLRDKFDFGTTRCERFLEGMKELIDAINNDYLTIEDIQSTLEEELRIKFQE